MVRFLYYAFLIPLSLLPMRVLYWVSDLLFFSVYRVFGYRKEVVLSNISRSFPNKSPAEVKKIARGFYSHFCDLIIESIALFTMSEREVINRFQPLNLSLINELYDKKRSVIIASGHYNNWELAAVAINPQIKHQTNGVFTPLSNTYLNKKFRQSREKFGLVLRPKSDTKEMFRQFASTLTATGFGIDQCPSRGAKKAYWMQFLHQETAVMFGTEKYAKEYDTSVIFMRVNKVKRGYYTYAFDMVAEFPKDTEYGFITEEITRLLENQIIAAPEYWLWSHKRWKLKKEA